MNGGNLEVLAKILGHSSTSTTQHYAHLAPDFFGDRAFDMVAVDLSRPTGNVVNLPRSGGPLGQRMGRAQEFAANES
jgi:hypothetical protein